VQCVKSQPHYAKRFEMMAQMILRCKRVRVDSDSKNKKQKEYIRIIFSFKNQN